MAKAKLGYEARTQFEDLVVEMVDADMKAVRQEMDRNNRHD